MIICGTPSVVCALFMLFLLPESPKFSYSQGDEAATLKALERIHKCNLGEKVFNVKSLVKDEEFQDACERKSSNYFLFMWSQTAPLFKHPHLRNTLTACFIQFCIFNSSNGFWTFFPEIVNRIALWKDSNSSHVSATICEILRNTIVVPGLNGTLVDAALCVTKLEPSTYQNGFVLNSLYFFGWLFLAFFINRLGKLLIIETILFLCGGCGFALIFMENPSASTNLYMIVLAVGLAFTVLNASTVELFPTRLRFVISTQRLQNNFL